MAFTTRMVSGYNRGGVTIHAPSGDDNLIAAPAGVLRLGYNPRPVRGRQCFARLLVSLQCGYNPRPVRGRQSQKQETARTGFGVTIHAPSGDDNPGDEPEETVCYVTIHAPSGDDNAVFPDLRQNIHWLQSTPRQGTTIPYGPYDYELQFLPR